MGWEVRPKHGYTPLELYDVGINRKNAELLYIRRGVVIHRLDYDSYFADAVNARMPTIKVTVQTPRMRRAVTRELSYKRMLYSGSSPFRQIIEDEIRKSESLKRAIGIEELADNVAKLTAEKPSRILKLIRRMAEAGQIFIKDGRAYVGITHPEIGIKREYPLIEFKAGKHPIKMYIFDYVNQVGTRSYKEIENRMMRIGWIKRVKTLQRYLREMVKEGNLRKIGEEKDVFGRDEDYEAVIPP